MKKCRFCDYRTDSFSYLRRHAQTEHSEAWMKVERWIDESTGPKIRSAVELAAEGMLGARERQDG